MAALRDLELGRGRRIPARLLSVRFTRSSGPGGQNVNKLATRAELRLDLDAAEAVLGARSIARVRARWPRRLDARGRLRVVCGRRRSQARNVELACTQMESLLVQALAVTRARRATRPSAASRERRLGTKRRTADRKRQRRRPSDQD